MTDESADVLILAAHPAELAPFTFSAALGPGLRGRRGRYTVAAQSVGVGMPAAGAGTCAALLRARPRSVLLVGSYGLYPTESAFQPGRVLIPGSIVAADEAVLAGRAAVPDVMPARVETHQRLSATVAALDPHCARGSLATTLGITTDDVLASWLGARTGCEGENLEALAVGLACERLSVPFACVLGCTNRVGSQGRAQWLAHHAQVASLTAALVLRWLQSGPELPALR